MLGRRKCLGMAVVICRKVNTAGAPTTTRAAAAEMQVQLAPIARRRSALAERRLRVGTVSPSAARHGRPPRFLLLEKPTHARKKWGQHLEHAPCWLHGPVARRLSAPSAVCLLLFAARRRLARRPPRHVRAMRAVPRPGPFNQSRTCISGQLCEWGGLLGYGLGNGDRIMVLDSCGRFRAPYYNYDHDEDVVPRFPFAGRSCARASPARPCDARRDQEGGRGRGHRSSKRHRNSKRACRERDRAQRRVVGMLAYWPGPERS